MTTALIPRQSTVPAELQEKVLLGGDLAQLTPQERLAYYNAVCTSIGLNPLTRPFEYLILNEKMQLYARKDCTDQLRDLHGISVEIASREIIDGVIVVTARAKNMTERTDESIGAVPVVSEQGEWKSSQSGKRYFQGNGTYKQLGPLERANAFMKAETKAKRRVTLSICGLGVLDESEIEGTDGKKLYHAEDGTEAEKTPAQIRELLLENKQPISQPDPAPPVDESYKEARGCAPSTSGLSPEEAIRRGRCDDAPEEPQSDPTAPYRRTLAACDNTNAAYNAWWGTVPEEIRQDLYDSYTAALKKVGKKR